MDVETELRGLADPEAVRICAPVFIEPRFFVKPASASHHPGPHQQPGGLALHTLEVARSAMAMAGEDRRLARLAYIAAVFHDYGKIYEYAFAEDGTVNRLPFAKHTGHVVYGWKFFLDASEYSSLAMQERDAIAHAILAHHGRREWGSPVEPQSRLAFILHTADMLSAKGINAAYDCQDQGS